MADFASDLDAALAGTEGPQRKYAFLDALNRHLAAPAVLVGGSAVELYADGAVTSKDIDLIGARKDIRRLLLDAGFQEDGRYLFDDGRGLVVEVPGERLRDSEQPVRIRYRGHEVLVVGPEDALVDRLLSAKSWHSREDWERAIVLATAQAGRLDREALRRKARANDVEDILDELLALTEPL